MYAYTSIYILKYYGEKFTSPFVSVVLNGGIPLNAFILGRGR